MVQSREDLSSYYDSDKHYSFNYVVQEILKQYKQIDFAGCQNVLWDKISYKNILGGKVTVAPLLHRACDTNGMTIYYWSYYPGGCSIWVDVNGSSNAPNTFGKDMFALEIREKNIYAFGQFAKGDWCRGKGTTLGVRYVQAATPPSPSMRTKESSMPTARRSAAGSTSIRRKCSTSTTR